LCSLNACLSALLLCIVSRGGRRCRAGGCLSETSLGSLPLCSSSLTQTVLQPFFCLPLLSFFSSFASVPRVTLTPYRKNSFGELLAVIVRCGCAPGRGTSGFCCLFFRLSFLLSHSLPSVFGDVSHCCGKPRYCRGSAAGACIVSQPPKRRKGSEEARTARARLQCPLQHHHTRSRTQARVFTIASFLDYKINSEIITILILPARSPYAKAARSRRPRARQAASPSSSGADVSKVWLR
jgi:hypothetical protein